MHLLKEYAFYVARKKHRIAANLRKFIIFVAFFFFLDTDIEDEFDDDEIKVNQDDDLYTSTDVVDDLETEPTDEEIHQQDQFDNNLPPTRYITKMMRLNSECSDPTLLENCRPGQKWKCINENGRWRKHKCKFHVRSHFNVTFTYP